MRINQYFAFLFEYSNQSKHLLIPLIQSSSEKCKVLRFYVNAKRSRMSSWRGNLGEVVEEEEEEEEAPGESISYVRIEIMSLGSSHYREVSGSTLECTTLHNKLHKGEHFPVNLFLKC